MGSEINPYEISKDIFKKVSSLHFQNFTMVIILALSIFKKFFDNDFKVFTNTILSYFPNSFKINVHNITLPLLKFLLFLSSIGGLMLIFLIIIFAINEKFGLFKALIYNYNRFFRGDKIGIFDEVGEKLLIKPYNFTIIILGLCYLLGDTQLLSVYFQDFKNIENSNLSISSYLTILRFMPFVFITCYYTLILPLTFIFKKIEE